MPDSDDTPTRLAILPDWNEGVRLVEEFDSNASRSFAGKEQRSAKRTRPKYRLEYIRSGLIAAEAKRRLIEIRLEFEGPLIVPIWPDGTVLQEAMSVQTSALLDTNIPDEYSTPFDVYLWTPDIGGEFRTVTSNSSRTLTLSGSGTLYPTGAFIFPCKRATREIDFDAIDSIDIETGTEKVRFLTL